MAEKTPSIHLFADVLSRVHAICAGLAAEGNWPAGIDLSRVTFSAEFARNLDYYTGFVFEARHQGRRGDHPVIGGGRYDRLLRLLGASEDIPAVGASIWLDRLSGPETGMLQ